MTFQDIIAPRETSTILTVSDLTTSLKNLLENRFPSILVQGEITNFKAHSTGHYYFDLKDAGAKISAVMFRSNAASVTRLPKEGDSVVVSASLAVYPPQGKYQLVVRSMRHHGIGELLLKLEELKRKLGDLGWFAKERKKPLPKFPTCIGVITSPTGAVIRDIIHVLERRNSNFSLLLSPVKVQGKEAASEVARAIDEINQHKLADVIIVARGGGSLEDLWAFNEEVVAQAIFRSAIPIISAIGHETDFTIADFVADCRAPTPSAAAEIVLEAKTHHLQFLLKTKQALEHTLSHLVGRNREKLIRFASHPFFTSPYTLLGMRIQRLDEIKSALGTLMKQKIVQRRLLVYGRHKQAQGLKPTVQLATFKKRLFELDKRLLQSQQGLIQFKMKQTAQLLARLESIDLQLHAAAFKKRLYDLDKNLSDAEKRLLLQREERLTQLTNQLSSLNPKNVLHRGYSILFAQKEGSVIVSAQEINRGEKVRALLADGELSLTVDE